MSELPAQGVILNGGCYCSNVRYKIIIPSYQDRPVTTTNDKNKGRGEIRFPSINFDHCNDCRKATGTLVPSWIICPQSWVKWSVTASEVQFSVPTGCSEGSDIKDGKRVEIASEEFVQIPTALDGLLTAFNSSPETWRTFCSKCGTNLSFVCLTKRGADKVPQIDINFGSLDRESLEKPGVRPNAHFYCRYGIDWVQKVLWEGDSTIGGEALYKYPEGSRLENL